MIVRYDVTLPDMIDVMLRGANRREPRLGWRWQESFVLSLVLGALFGTVIDAPESARTLGAVGLFAVSFAIFTYLQRSRVHRALGRYVAEQFGPSVPFTFEIEITGAGMITKQLGEEVRREWSNVQKVTEATGGIEFDIQRGGMVFVRDTGFHSPQERAEFLRLARQYAQL